MAFGRMGARGGFGGLGVLGGARPGYVPYGAIGYWNFSIPGQAWPRPATVEFVDSRSSDQWVTMASGLLVKKSSGVLSCSDQYLLVEGSSTNKDLYSNTFDNAVWGSGGATITPAAGVSPDGTNNAYRLQLAAGAQGSKYINQNTTGPGSQTHTVAAYVMSNTGSAQNFALKLTQAAIADHFSSDLAATTSWKRFNFSYAFGAGGAGTYNGIVGPSAGTAVDLLIYGYELELNQAFSTSYIPDTTAAATRVANAIQIQRVGVGRIVYTFDDNSQQTVSGINTAAQYTLPTNLNRPLIKSIAEYAA